MGAEAVWEEGSCRPELPPKVFPPTGHPPETAPRKRHLLGGRRHSGLHTPGSLWSTWECPPVIPGLLFCGTPWEKGRRGMVSGVFRRLRSLAKPLSGSARLLWSSVSPELPALPTAPEPPAFSFLPK